MILLPVISIYALVENNKSQLEEEVILLCGVSYSKTKLALI